MTRHGVWCREGEGWIVGLGASRTFVRDSKGMAHLAHLLDRPRDQASALDLVAGTEGAAITTAQDAGPLLDPEARSQYRRRLEALATEIAKAERLGDAKRSEAARSEFDFLTRELKGATGLGGRDRKAGSNLERARVNVTRSIKSAIDRIERQDATLAAHLRTCVRTGSFCAYEPHHDEPVQWDRAGGASGPAPPAPAVPAATRAPAALTVMFLDLEDSTALMERLGEDAWMELLAVHNDVVRDRVAEHGGAEVKAMGDGFMLTFDDPRSAVWCAADIQRALTSHSTREPDRPLRVRIGIHRGDARHDAGDVFGRTVVVAARLCQQATGGQVLLSDTVRDAAGDLGELSVSPSAAVQLRGLRGRHQVCELQWRTGEPQAASPRGGAAAARAVALLEREPELEVLRRALREATGGAGALVVVQGAAGIGKSSLVLELLEEAEAAGARTLRARATRLESQVPFAAARRLFEGVARGLEPAVRERLVRGAVRPAAAMIGLAEAGSDAFSGESNAMHIHNGLFWLAAELAERQPLVVALDDAHLADPQTLEWIEYAADRLADVAVCVIVSGRGGAESPLAGVETVARELISPRPLSVRAVAEAVRALWPEATSGFIRACHATSGGNPFFLREILAAAHAAGIAPDDDGVTRLPEATPESVARTILGRIRAEGPAARALSRALAVLGGQAELSLVTALAELDPTAALAAADALDRAEIVEGAAILAFAHPLIGGIVERDLRAGERALLHERAARLLRDRQAPSPAVAAHLLHARPMADPMTIATLRAAAQAAARGGAPEAAARLLERAVAEPPTPEALPEVLLELGRALLDAGAEHDAETHLERALALAAHARVRGRVMLTLSSLQERRDAGARVAQIDALIAELGDEDAELQSALQARAIELLGDLMMATPSAQMTEAHDDRLRRAVATGPGSSPGDRQLIAIYAVHRSIRAGISAAEAHALALGALDDGVLMRRLAGGEWAADSAIEVLSMTDAFEQADHHAREAERHARETGAITAEAYACMLRSMVALHRGALADVEALLRSVFAITRRLHGPKYVEYSAQQTRAVAAIERGDLATAARAADAMAREGVRPWGAPAALGRLYAARGEHELAVAFLSSAYEMHRVAGIWRTTILGSPAPELVASLVALGRREEALSIAQEDVAAARRFGAPSSVGAALRALALADDPERAIGHLTEAASVLAPSLALLVRAYVLCDLGAALWAAGDAQGARHLLRQALELGVRCGSRRVSERARGELALAGVADPVVEQAPAQLLSPAERRAAELAAEGADDREIAQALFLSPRAVAEQLATAIGKLGLRSRDELADALREPALAA